MPRLINVFYALIIMIALTPINAISRRIGQRTAL